MWTYPIFVISLKDRLDRRAAAAAQLAKVGLTPTFFDAVEGKKLPADEIAAVYDDAGRRRRVNKSLTGGELGCYLSHWAIFEKMVAENIPLALILEDDCLINDSLPRMLDCLTDPTLPPFDLVKMAIGEMGLNRGFYPVRKLTQEAALVRHLNICNSTVAYVISLAGARRFMRYGMPIRYPIDVALNRFWVHGLNILAVRPWPVLHDLSQESTIGGVRFENKGREKGSWLSQVERRARKAADSLAKRAYIFGGWIGDSAQRRKALADGAITQTDL